jgi:hypothetical protein
MADLQTDLTEALDQATWEWLKPHVARDAIIIVSETLTLVEVGVAIVNNQTATVEAWITAQLIAKPTVAQLQEWNVGGDRTFTALIVQPYVLIQP